MLQEVSESFLAADASAFNRARVLSASGFRSWRQVFIRRRRPSSADPLQCAAPLRWAWILYRRVLRAFEPAIDEGWPRHFRTGLLQLYGFVLRSWIAGRAPVTNMYEIHRLVSLGVAAFALIFELIYRSRSMC